MKGTITMAVGAASLLVALSAGPMSAAPDTGCLRAGLATLRGAGLLDDAARGGVPISLALDLGVTVRPGADISGLSDPIPFSTLLADHRAGASSLFIYPWC